VTPASAPAGSIVTIYGNTPLFAKSGHYIGPSGTIGFWWNMPPKDWVHAYFGRTPATTNGGSSVLHLGEADVEGLCTYRVRFEVPAVPPGRYPVVPIEHDRRGAAGFQAIVIHVIG
jgi:hypothetical protein